MKKEYLQLKKAIQDRLQNLRDQINAAIRKHWYKVAFLMGVALLANYKDLSVHIRMSAGAFALFNEPETREEVVWYEDKREEARPVSTSYSAKPMNISQILNKKKTKPENRDTEQENASEVNFNTSLLLKKALSPEEDVKRKKQLRYVKRFNTIAVQEMERYGIPASITLAQGLLESNNGDSRLTTQNNNHFGIKCFSRSCKKGHCSNFSDDSHKDFFRKYDNAWESYRAHSQLLQKDRYLHLYKLKRTDYRSWARGLQKAGYATDKRYADKLIETIEDLELSRYDQR